TGVSAFAPAQLREQFYAEPGSWYNATALVRGLERIKNLYADKGYVNFAAIPTPQVDEASRTIVLNIDADEGKPVNFGSLILSGQEPRAGAGKSLLTAWSADMEGKPYSPTQFKHWLSAHAPWSSDTPEGRLYVTTLLASDLQRLNIRLEFP
ncbi:MAG TPA: POTRA domain-containing protein, partial [Terracidiphilus sp.]